MRRIMWVFIGLGIIAVGVVIFVINRKEKYAFLESVGGPFRRRFGYPRRWGSYLSIKEIESPRGGLKYGPGTDYDRTPIRRARGQDRDDGQSN